MQPGGVHGRPQGEKETCRLHPYPLPPCLCPPPHSCLLHPQLFPLPTHTTQLPLPLYLLLQFWSPGLTWQGQELLPLLPDWARLPLLLSAPIQNRVAAEGKGGSRERSKGYGGMLQVGVKVGEARSRHRNGGAGSRGACGKGAHEGGQAAGGQAHVGTGIDLKGQGAGEQGKSSSGPSTPTTAFPATAAEGTNLK